MNKPSGGIMKVQIRDTIITDEYSVITKTDNILKIAKKIADSPNGLVIVKGKNNKILGVVTFREIINAMLESKDLSKLKFNDVIQKNIMTVTDTDNIEKVIKRIKRRKPIATIVVDKKGSLAGFFSESDLSYANACQQLINNILK